MLISRILSHLKTNKPGRAVFIFLLSLVYFGLFSVFFNLTHIPVFAAFGFILLIPVTWIWGIRSGIFLLFFDVLWTSSVLLFSPAGLNPFSIDAAIGISLQTVLILLIGFIRSLYKKLKNEVEERQRAESRLIEYQNKLEQTIKERTDALENAYIKIYHNEKMQAVGQLAGGIAHDFNNKMTVILGYCDLLIKKLGIGSPYYGYLEQIRISGLQSSELTRQLLAFARRGVYHFNKVNINELISEVLALLARSFPNHITLHHSLDSTSPFIWGGIPQLQNAILNMALNAKDAMPSGGTLTIRSSNAFIDDAFIASTGQKCEPGNHVLITLTDTGCGIAPEIQKRIFEPFFTTKKDGKGTGMGLAAVYGIVESHKGFITVNSILNEGTTFTIYLPVTTNEIRKTDVQIQEKAHKDDEHIFVIDDENNLAEIFKDMLETTGYTVTISSNATEAVQIYSKEYPDFDLVLIDMSMPDFSGLELFQQLKAINPSITALLTSGYALIDQVELAMLEGVAGFVQKPCDRYELHIAIQKALGAKQIDKNIPDTRLISG